MNCIVQAQQPWKSYFSMDSNTETIKMHIFQLGHVEMGPFGHNLGWWRSFLTPAFCQVSYNAGVLKSRKSGTFDMYNIGKNLISDLLDVDIGQEPCCPVVLVGHNFGGVLIKQLCAYASRATCGLKQNSERRIKHTTFLENVKGIFFYSTPHYGIADDIAEQFVAKGPLLEYVKTLSTTTARLNFDFEKLWGQSGQYQKWRIAAIGESLPMKLG